MREAQDKVAKLCDIDEQTFVRFGEFAYTGNYASARDTARHTEGNPNHGGPDLGLPPPGAVSKKRGGYTQKACNYCGHGSEEQPRKRILWAEFRQRYQSGSMVCCETRKNMEEGEDYTDVFLCHARVYAFAEKYDSSIARLGSAEAAADARRFQCMRKAGQRHRLSRSICL
jgi:hypothetical protein